MLFSHSPGSSIPVELVVMLMFRLRRDLCALCPGMGRERGQDSQEQAA